MACVTICLTEPFFAFLLVPFITPSSYTAYLDEPNVTFKCVAASNASDISWEVNDMSASEVQDRGISTTINRTQGLHESNLTITSTIGNNNTHIECLVFSGSLHFIVSEAVFRVQGQLFSFTDNKLMFVRNF